VTFSEATMNREIFFEDTEEHYPKQSVLRVVAYSPCNRIRIQISECSEGS